MTEPLHWRIGDWVLAFSSHHAGDMGQRDQRQAWAAGQATGTLVVPRQVHGSVIAEASDRETLQRADGVVSRDASLMLGVLGADCPGVALLADDARCLVHAGWRGTAKQIVAAGVAALAAVSTQPVATWHAFVGPGISAGRYQVDQPVIDARVWPEQSLTPDGPNHAYLDLPGALVADCRAAGLTTITTAGICTASDPRLRSYRHHGRCGSQLLACWHIETAAQQSD